jgi:hypothetical protein
MDGLSGTQPKGGSILMLSNLEVMIPWCVLFMARPSHHSFASEILAGEGLFIRINDPSQSLVINGAVGGIPIAQHP